MDLDALLRHYFGSADPAAIDAGTRARGKRSLAADFRAERDPGRRFALWILMDGLDIAPAPAVAFAGDMMLRDAAEDYLTAAWRRPEHA
jgi:hypothetical protein